MKSSWLLFIFSLLLASMSFGSFQEADRAMQLYNSNIEKWEIRYAHAPDEPTRQTLLETRPNTRRTTQTIMKNIGTQLNDANALRAILWIYENDPVYLKQAESLESGNAIRRALEKSHFNRPGAGDLCIAISSNFSNKDLPYMEKVAKHASSPEDKGLASLAISISLANLGDNQEVHQKRLQHLKQAVQNLPTDAQVNGIKASDIIVDHLYFINNLAKGKKAPSFIGRNVGGTPISGPKQGKVTAVVFWSDQVGKEESWLESLRNMQTICKKHNAEMVGVYTGDPIPLTNQIANRQVTWPNLYDESYEVTRKYRILNGPIVYLLDKAGKIQSVSEPNPLINLSIQALAE